MSVEFLNNKYTNWYVNIIAKAVSEGRIKLKKDETSYVYYEKHHIIPRSFGGSNNSENLVLLTAKEHYLCHLLLTKMCYGDPFYKMIYAFNFLSYTNNNRKLTSKMYQRLKNELSNIPISEQTRKKMSNAQKGKPKSQEHAINIGKAKKGVIHSAEHRAKISKTLTGRPSLNIGRKHTDIARTNMSLAHIGHTHSEESKKKISKSSKGREPINKGKKMSEEYCKKLSEIKKGRPWTEARWAAHKGAWNCGLTKENDNRIIGRPWSEENKKKLSDTMKKSIKNNPLRQGRPVVINYKEYSSLTEAAVHLACNRRKLAYKISKGTPGYFFKS